MVRGDRRSWWPASAAGGKRPYKQAGTCSPPLHTQERSDIPKPLKDFLLFCFEDEDDRPLPSDLLRHDAMREEPTDKEGRMAGRRGRSPLRLGAPLVEAGATREAGIPSSEVFDDSVVRSDLQIPRGNGTTDPRKRRENSCAPVDGKLLRSSSRRHALGIINRRKKGTHTLVAYSDKQQFYPPLLLSSERGRLASSWPCSAAGNCWSLVAEKVSAVSHSRL